MPRTRLLERYLYRELLGPLLFSVAAFTLMMIAGDLLFQLARMLVDGAVSVGTALQIFALGLPRVMVLVLPMSTLLGTLLCYSRLSAGSEVVAMRAAGMSLQRVMAPAVALALLVSLVTVALNETVVPAANRTSERIMWEVGRRKNPFVQERTVIKEFDGGALARLIYADSYDAREKVFKRVTVQEFENGKLARITEAARARWEDTVWWFEDGVVYTVLGGDRVASVRFARQEARIAHEPSEVAKGALTPQEMSARELADHIRDLAAQGANTSRLLVELYLKFAIPFASLVFGLVGAPLGIRAHRASTSLGFGMSILIIFVYYVIMSLSCAVAERGSAPPAVGAWFSNMVFGICGALMIARKS
ncbi:MAG: LptF/LptG family permease [Firmicutes bacterium]|nr:LptF/LptG family permease [Bacillota bacterium]MDH7494394.1 LptF/LptG family permease [Bacillota bacterium]